MAERRSRKPAEPPRPIEVRHALANLEIALVLEELADLLELQGANPFQVRAWRNAVRLLRGLPRPLCEMAAEGEDLTALPGVGKDIAGALRELLETGALARVEEAAARVPRSLPQLMRVEGLGAKKAKRLFEELGVATLDDLRAALDDGRVAALSGFGKASAGKLRTALANVQARPQRMLLFEAEQVVEPLLAHLRGLPQVKRLEIAGSFRRRRDTVGDLDVLVAAEDGGAVLAAFSSWPGFARLLGAGPTKASGVLSSGLQVDLRVVPEGSFGAALHYFTGSKEHVVAIRKIGVERGLRINEYGVFRADAPDRPLGGATEQEVFAAVGLPLIPPELREDRGEIQAAARGKLPELVTLEDLRGDLQLQSTWTDGKDSLEDLVRACKALGYEYMAITDHTKAVVVAGGMDADGFRRQWEEIDRLRREHPEIVLLRSAEVDILKDGSLDLPDDCLDEMDLVLVSIHSHRDLDRTRQTDRILRGMSHPKARILGHPTGRKINRREPMDFDLDAVLKAAVELDVAVEVDAQPARLDLDDVRLLRARELGCWIAIDTDAHAVAHLQHARLGVGQARRGWVEKSRVVNALPWPRFREWMTRSDRRRLPLPTTPVTP